jgi:hypothetical protein
LSRALVERGADGGFFSTEFETDKAGHDGKQFRAMARPRPMFGARGNPAGRMTTQTLYSQQNSLAVIKA